MKLTKNSPLFLRTHTLFTSKEITKNPTWLSRLKIMTGSLDTKSQEIIVLSVLKPVIICPDKASQSSSGLLLQLIAL